MPVPIDYCNIRRMSTITVPKQDIHLDVYNFQQCKPQSNIDSTFESRRLEADYCKNFTCCGQTLDDLHDLLQHYEECHVQSEMEDENDDEEENDDAASTWGYYTPPVSPTDQVPPSSPFDLLRKTKTDLYSTYNPNDTSPLHMVNPYEDENEEEYDYEDDYEEENDQENAKFCGKKRNFQQYQASSSSSSSSGMDLLTISAAKKLALATGESLNCLTDEEFLAHAGVLLASANTSYLYADKPYKCTVQGCDKAYKNPNGLKYHKEHGHCSLMEENEIPKPYQCTIGDCGKRYKNLNGLKYHIEHSHMAALNHTLASFGCSLLPSPPSSTSVSPSTIADSFF
ncbi:hypothetical protein BJ944DRAFT_243506 [Cunninghamella echinulata]|nr:hypothetical protein BJ944DRAFT_243506 [Cunninghamella echinulata]